MKKISTPLGMLLCLLISTSLLAQDAFITTWMTNSSETTISIPANSTGYNYNYDVDWENDGIYDTFGVTGVITHDYGVAGTYTIAIKGEFPKIDFGTNGDRNKLTNINQWGSQKWVSMESSFYYCTNLTINATDNPDLTLVTDMSNMFRNATSFNSDISAWNVSQVTNMSFMFYKATTFNQPIDGWDVSNVTNMTSVFMNALAFNQNIDAWDVSNVTTMESMFNYAQSFNQPIGSWNVGNVTNMYRMFYSSQTFNQPIDSWDVSHVTNMHYMFWDSYAFNQPIGDWDVSSVTNMAFMFGHASSFNQPIDAWNVGNVTTMFWMFGNAVAFNQEIGSWDVSKVINMQNMFYGATLSTNNYDNLLTNWSLLPLKNNVVFSGPNNKYCNGENARQSILNDFGWTIIDAGLDCSNLSVSDFDNSNITLSPNPIQSSFIINGLGNEGYLLQISNLNGQIIKKLPNYDLNPISIESFAEGVYFVNIKSELVSKTIKVIKTK